VHFHENSVSFYRKNKKYCGAGVLKDAINLIKLKA
jgi:hypothetical protein